MTTLISDTLKHAADNHILSFCEILVCKNVQQYQTEIVHPTFTAYIIVLYLKEFMSPHDMLW